MKIYLASSYSRRRELQSYAKQLRADGHEITSVWLTGIHELPGWHEARYAADDFRDVQIADALIHFSAIPDGSRNRGGADVEFGMALALGKVVAVVGPRRHCFHYLPQVLWCEEFDPIRVALKERSHA